MAATPLHICMDSTDWLKGLDPESALMDPSFSSSDSDGLITCPPLLSPPPPAHSSGVFDRRLRPQQEQALKCPRCDSTHTKFCYYNNYSLSQPRYFCKTCRRYWTKGGSLRNVPVGGGCRKNKRPAISKKTSSSSSSSDAAATAHHHHLSFSDLQFPHFDSAAAAAELSFIECKYNPFMLGGSGRQFLFGGGGGDLAAAGFSLGLPFEHNNNTAAMAAAAAAAAEVKPAAERMLAIDWEEQRCAEAGREAVGYGNGLGLWGARMIGGGRGHPATT